MMLDVVSISSALHSSVVLALKIRSGHGRRLRPLVERTHRTIYLMPWMIISPSPLWQAEEKEFEHEGIVGSDAWNMNVLKADTWETLPLSSDNVRRVPTYTGSMLYQNSASITWPDRALHWFLPPWPRNRTYWCACMIGHLGRAWTIFQHICRVSRTNIAFGGLQSSSQL